MSRKRPPLAALALIAIVVLISACGSTAPASSSGAKNTAANPEKAVKFAECMRHNGVSAFPDPPASGEFTIDGIANGSSLDTSTPAFTQAISACQNLEPAGFTGSKRSAQKQEVALKFARCMRANGVPSFPDPSANGALINVNGAHSIPGFQAAADKCLAVYRGALGLGGQ